MDTPNLDAERIEKLGGSTKVAEILTDRGGRRFTVQRVQNWKERGIPAAVKVLWPDLFMPDLLKRGKKKEGGNV
jgi:hypothetical protein